MITKYVKQDTGWDSKKSTGDLSINSDRDDNLIYVQEVRRGTKNQGDGPKYKGMKFRKRKKTIV